MELGSGGASYGEQAERDGAHEFERGYCSGGHGFESELLLLTDGPAWSKELRLVSCNKVEV